MKRCAKLKNCINYQAQKPNRKTCPPYAAINFVLEVCNSNWTEWSTIQAVIGRVISKSAEREAQDRFEITSTITP